MKFRVIASLLVVAGVLAAAFLADSTGTPAPTRQSPSSADESALKSMSINN